MVVVSAGTAGLAAAATAAEKGIRVISLEKSKRTGGTAIQGTGPFAVESTLQKKKMLTLTREEAFKIYMDFNHWSVNARLVKTLIDRSAGVIKWLEGMGLAFMDVGPHNPGNNCTMHIPDAPEKGPGQIGRGATMMKILADRAKELGAQILLQTPVRQILKKNGRITGVIAENKSGEEIRVKAGAVIIATGGFGGGFISWLPLAGDGIQMAAEVGADVTEPTPPVKAATSGSRPPSWGKPFSKGFFYSVIFTFQQPGLLMLNKFGERFTNEEFGANAVTTQKDETAFTIFDEDTKRYFVEEGFDVVTAGFQVPITDARDFDAELKQILDRGSKNIFVADSIEDLAAKTGIELDSLRRNLDEYNRMCETGRDTYFNKNIRYLRPVKQPKFYVNKRVGIGPMDSRVWEGIRINHKTEVLTKDFEVIPGLYAAGIDASCNVYRDVYPMILPGTAMGFALGEGRIAAESAAEYIKTIGR